MSMPEGAEPTDVESPEPAESFEAPEVPVEAEAPAPTSFLDDPSVRQAIQEEAAAIARAQTEAQLEQFYANLQQQAEQQGYYEQQQSYAPQQMPEYDPLDPESAQQYFEARDERLLGAMAQMFDQMLDQRMAPIYEQQEQTRNAEGMERIKDVLADAAAREGDFDQDAARRLAMSFLPAAQQRYGETPRAGEAALMEAARFIRQVEANAEKRGADKLRNQLSGGRELSAEPGTPGAAVQVGGIKATDELDFATKYVNALNRHS